MLILGEISSNDPEVKKTSVTFANNASKPNDDLNEVLQRFSSWTRLKKVLAWSLRYKNLLRKQVQRRKTHQVISYPSNAERVTTLSVSEMKEAEKEIIRYVQKQSFAEEVQFLSQTKITIAGIGLGAIRRNVDQIADFNGRGRAWTPPRNFGFLTGGMVTESQRMLLSENLEIRKKDECC